MPSKRSRSEERERKRRYREKREPEKILLDKYTERERMKERRAKASKTEMEKECKVQKYNEQEENRKRIRSIRAHQTTEEKGRENDKAKARMAALRSTKTDEEKEINQEEARERMEKLRIEKSIEDSDYERVIKRHKMREVREKYTGKEHLVKNLEAKKGMQLLNQEGRLRKFTRRESEKKSGNLLEWKNYWKKGEGHRIKLEERKPDIVERINEQIRLENERERNQQKTQEENICGDWSSDNEYDDGDSDCYHILTREEQEMAKEEEKLEREAVVNLMKQSQKEKREKARGKLKEAIQTPMNPLPERELCQYEKIREDIIKEREEAMAKFNFYEDLNKTKDKIGFYASGYKK
jgi:hypothetical protein